MKLVKILIISNEFYKIPIILYETVVAKILKNISPYILNIKYLLSQVNIIK